MQIINKVRLSLQNIAVPPNINFSVARAVAATPHSHSSINFFDFIPPQTPRIKS
jgi:hypothetical protein